MPLLDLSRVTTSVMELLKHHVNFRFLGLLPNDPAAVQVVPQSPDKIENATRTLSLYLYHVIEDPHYKNFPHADGAAGPSIDRISLALCLYYVLSAHHAPPGEENPELNALEEQKIFGYALKTLHDFPVITDNTTINGNQIIDGELFESDNNIQIIFRPVPPEDSINFWSAEDKTTTRLSAYYEIRVILFEPEEPTVVPGFVLSLGSFVQPIGAPIIERTEGVFRFTPPGFAEVVLTTSPARVPIEPSGADDPPNNRLRILGQKLGAGKIALRSALFATPGNQIILDPDLNPDWMVVPIAGGLKTLVQGTIETTGGPVIVYPGTYGLSVKVVTLHKLPDNTIKEIETSSNECPITLTPFVTDVMTDLIAPTPTATLTLAGDFDVLASELDGQIEVYVSGDVYTFNSDPAHEPGTFDLQSPDKIILDTDFTDADPGIYPVRVRIRGAEAPPVWIEVPEP